MTLDLFAFARFVLLFLTTNSMLVSNSGIFQSLATFISLCFFDIVLLFFPFSFLVLICYPLLASKTIPINISSEDKLLC